MSRLIVVVVRSLFHERALPPDWRSGGGRALNTGCVRKVALATSENNKTKENGPINILIYKLLNKR